MIEPGSSFQQLLALYQAKGLSIFPLQPKKKKPTEEWAIWQQRRPTPDEVSTWFKNGTRKNVAIATGQISGYIVLDEDDPPVFRAWLAEHNYHLPPTATVKTSTYKDDQGNTHQKFHYYFKHPGGKIKNMIKKIPGADIKADGGYVVAPPSIHPSGEQYEWCFGLSLDDYGDTPAPPWLIECLEREVSPQVPLASSDLLPPDEDWVTNALRGVNKGERNNISAKLAGYYLGRGEPEPRVLEMLRSWNFRNPEPLSDKEIQATVASVARREARNRIRTGAQEGKPESESKATSDLPWEEQRQAALQGLGERLGLPLTDIRITKSDESVFEFFLGEADSVVVTGDQLAEQRLFKKRFINAGLLVPKKVKEPKEGGAWDEVVRQIIRLAILQDVGQESSAIGELREFLNVRVESQRSINFYSPSDTIPNHVAFFIIQRKNEPPKLYCRVSELFIEARNYGYKSIKKLTVLLPSLGHEPELFKWNRKNIRAWCMNLDSMSQDIKEMVFKRAIEGKDKEDSK
jgi:hypothetical protein